MRTAICSLAFGVLVLLGVASTTAEVIDGTNWADEAVGYSTNIQNYGGELMGPATEWWLTGPSDADVNGNGYAWDAEDQDTIGGWRAAAPGEYVTLYWEIGVSDLTGDDLVIHLYGGPGAAADVLASVDGDVFEQVGTIGSGTAGYFRDETFDFGGRFADDVHYVKVLRTTSGPQTGMFFDSFAANTPEPTSVMLLIVGALALTPRRR